MTHTQHEGGVSKLAKFQHLKNDPEFKDFINDILDSKLASQNPQETSKNRSKKGNDGRNNLVKSPSDTTLYSPGLRKIGMNPSNLTSNLKTIDDISNFVDGIRISTEVAQTSSNSKRSHGQQSGGRNVFPNEIATTSDGGHSSTSAKRRSVDARIVMQDTDRNMTDRNTDQLLLQAEKFKAKVDAPKGRCQNSLLMPYDYDQLRSKFVTDEGLGPIDNEIMFLRNFDQDDEFFHVTSQIDQSLRAKIERGEYIDLERLLPRDRFSTNVRGHDEINKQLFQLITQGTSNYLSPPDRSGNKINNVKKWDQAFRVFGAIYTQANPSRASEIWQYVHIIHTAASTNPWDSVAFYDITFRELMASKPWRSWGKIYSQGWNMAFHNSNTAYGNYANNGHSSNGHSSNRQQFQQSKDWKDDCCWLFNKNRCKKSSNDCKYHHRCTYCAGWYHSKANCKKRQNKSGGKPPYSNPSNNNSGNKATPVKADQK